MEATLDATATDLQLDTENVRELLLASYGLDASLRRLGARSTTLEDIFLGEAPPDG